MASSPADQLKTFNNELMHEKFCNVVMTKMSDIKFVFELESGDVSIAANKTILAASSPVFNAMFNGDLKEKGDVKIVDASPAAFEQFLQFFYKNHVTLSMEHIADVFNLVNKYDVADGRSICINFLKTNLNADNVLLALHLALKFEIDDLNLLCKGVITQNIRKVLGMFDSSDRNAQTQVNGINSKIDPFYSIYPYILDISKRVILCQSDEIRRLQVMNALLRQKFKK